MEQMDRKRKWIALSLWPLFGSRNWREITAQLDDLTSLFDMSSQERHGLLEMLPVETLDSDLHRLLDRADQEMKLESEGKFSIVTYDDPYFPNMLRTLVDCPLVLYCRGNTILLNSQSLAVVGTRHPSSYGIDVTGLFVREMAHHGITVVSGLAIGIDAVAHHQALEHNGNTIAVLGCGIDQDYPASNRSLRSRIETNGLVISEFSWRTPPKPEQFPRRNRIISGLSMGVIVVEAGIRSGALSTVNHALDLGRDVFAVPGPITSPISQGPLRMLQQGAIPLIAFQDIIDHYPSLSPRASRSSSPLFDSPTSPESIDPSLRPIWNLLSALPIHLDQIISRSGMSIATIHSALLDFELNGWVRQLPGKMFVLNV